MSTKYDAILVVSFGGPEGREDVIPFLENVLRGKPVPRERLLEVAEHYYHFEGKSPINDQCREFIAALKIELLKANVTLPVYWGNRNWHPMLTDTMQEMVEHGHERVLAFVTSGYSCYSGCRQYRENIMAAREAVGPRAPHVDKIRVFYNHPVFIAANAERVQAAIHALPASEHEACHVLYTAHSIPHSMSDHSDYVRQLTETCRLTSEKLGVPATRWKLVYQSRSGRPEDPWLEPDVCDHLETLPAHGVKSVVISPIGFLSDHMEVLYDLDTEAFDKCTELGLQMQRAATVGTSPKFVALVRELIEERMGLVITRRAIGDYPPNHDVCPENCCLYPIRRPSSPPVGSRS